MRVLGITGGVGAGKSAILDILEKEYGALIIKADEVAHILMSPGHTAYDTLVELLGDIVLDDKGLIDKSKMASLIFSNPDKRAEVNSIVHPAVKLWIKEKIRRENALGHVKLLVIEAALLLEDNYDLICDEVWYIYTDREVRRSRLKASRGYSDEKIDSIIASQMSDEDFRRRCNTVIDNSGDIDSTLKQIRGILGGC